MANPFITSLYTAFNASNDFDLLYIFSEDSLRSYQVFADLLTIIYSSVVDMADEATRTKKNNPNNLNSRIASHIRGKP